jgi:cytochrome b6-f complex iron-sulfur subunit
VSDPNHQLPVLNNSLDESPRFSQEKTRRDWLGLAAAWSAITALTAALVGAMRLPMPAVFPESQSKVKIGPPDNYDKGSATHLREMGIWLHRADDGAMYAISAKCTHLGCIAKRDGEGNFLCPCHGSAFASDGKVTVGPAPGPLNWLELSVAPDGQLVVDQTRYVKQGTRLAV